MKKLIALLMAATMAFSLCACGGGAAETPAAEDLVPSKEEMLAVAEEFSAYNIQNDSIDNIVRAKQTYCNKTLLLSGYIRNIKETHVELSAAYGANYMVDVYLSVDELVTLEEGQAITVVGTTTDEIIEESQNAAGYTFDYNHYQMPNAYLVKDRVEVTGILKGVNQSYNPAFDIEIGGSNVLKLIYFADGVDTSAFTFNQEIKFSAKAVDQGGHLRYFDAEIIE